MARRPVERDAYNVVVNGEGHYSLWPELKPLPEGWTLGGFAGTREQAIEWIAEKWDQIRK